MDYQNVKCLETKQIPVELIVSFSVEVEPVNDKNGNFKRFERVCRVEVKDENANLSSYEITPNELKRLRNLLTQSYGRMIKMEKELVELTKKGRGGKERTIRGVNWTYEVIAPPFSKITEQLEARARENVERATI